MNKLEKLLTSWIDTEEMNYQIDLFFTEELKKQENQ